MQLEEVLRSSAIWIARFTEFGAALLIAVGAVQALILAVPALLLPGRPSGKKRNAWRQFATWLLLALEFELGADIIRSAISPTWTDIGQLGAIAIIRTFLNYFLERDIEAITVSPPGKANGS